MSPLFFGILALGSVAASFTLLTVLGPRLTEGDAPALARRLQLLAGGPPAGVLLYWTAAGLRALYEPLYLHWLNRQVESRVRATVLSLDGQANALGETAGGPAVGLLADRGGLRLALTAAGLLLLPALAAFHRARTARATPGRG